MGIPTIGYGHTAGVAPGQTITVEQAEHLLEGDLLQASFQIDQNVRCSLNQNQYDALCAFIFNVGAGNFRKSTLLKYLNEGKMGMAAEEFLKWNKAGGQEVRGLTSRRKAEKALFEKIGL